MHNLIDLLNRSADEFGSAMADGVNAKTGIVRECHGSG